MEIRGGYQEVLGYGDDGGGHLAVTLKGVFALDLNKAQTYIFKAEYAW